MNAIANTQEGCMLFFTKIGKITNPLVYYLKGGGLFSIIPIWFLSFRLLNITNKFVRDIRQTILNCQEGCDDPKCLDGLYENVKYTRDSLIELKNKISSSKLSSLVLGKMTENALEEWDELAVDCKVASDVEFRNLIMNIAKSY